MILQNKYLLSDKLTGNANALQKTDYFSSFVKLLQMYIKLIFRTFVEN